MVKKSKKSKSKRVTLKKKYKVIRKVKEHHRKKAKEAKKLGLNRKSKVEKDPGIPNDWPFKEQELKALEERRARAIEELEQKKAARKERAKKRKLGLLEDDETSNNVEGEKGCDKVGTTAQVRDSSDRAFYKELVRVIEVSDVIVEVLDARDPLGTRCLDMEKMVLKSGPKKHLLLLLNKIDLVPKEAVEKWLKYLREELPAVAFKCSTQEQRSNLGWKSSKGAKPSNLMQTSDCLGAETLIKLLKNYSRSHEIKKSITVGVIGLPNVGKSSLINSLKRCHVVNVGATPGLTRTMQEVQLDKNVKLLDCPGVVMLKSSENDAAIALRNCKRIEKLDDPISPGKTIVVFNRFLEIPCCTLYPSLKRLEKYDRDGVVRCRTVNEILKLCPANLMVKIYNIPSFEAAEDFLQKVATARGRLKKGGIVDVDAAARIILRDWNEGKIPYYTMPPARDQSGLSEANIVTEYGKEFNIDEVYYTESSFIGSLKSIDDFDPVEVPSCCPLTFDENMVEEGAPSEPSNLDDFNIHETNGVDEDESMGVEDEEAGKNKERTLSRRQNEKLYMAEGILNPKVKKAEKKKRKTDTQTPMDVADDDDGNKNNGDYNFKVDYTRNKYAMADAKEPSIIETDA